MVENINTVYAKLPSRVGGFIMYDSLDDYYTIVLNSSSSYYRNKETFEHEIKHIINNDFTGYKEVGILELQRH